jgi:hypothetical protein
VGCDAVVWYVGTIVLGDHVISSLTSYHIFRCELFLYTEGGGSSFLQNVDMHLSNYMVLQPRKGTAVAQWLRCCTTNQKVTGSIPDGVIGIFHWHNPSNRIVALGSTQPLTEVSTRSISWG